MRIRYITALASIICSVTSVDAQQPDRNIAAWVSAGLGPGSVRGLGGVLHETISVGPYEVIARQSDIGPFFSGGPGITDHGFLLGARTGGERLFAAGALGYGRANPYHKFGEGGYPVTSPSAAALLYDVSLHANAVIPGVALVMSGAIGARQTSYLMTTINLELGWFGLHNTDTIRTNY